MCSPYFKAVECLLHTLLVVLHHVCVHVGIVAPDVALRAPVWNRAEAEWGVMLLGLLELGAVQRWKDRERERNGKTERKRERWEDREG